MAGDVECVDEGAGGWGVDDDEVAGFGEAVDEVFEGASTEGAGGVCAVVAAGEGAEAWFGVDGVERVADVDVAAEDFGESGFPGDVESGVDGGPAEVGVDEDDVGVESGGGAGEVERDEGFAGVGVAADDGDGAQTRWCRGGS